jgi:hypothetical protein
MKVSELNRIIEEIKAVHGASGSVPQPEAIAKSLEIELGTAKAAYARLARQGLLVQVDGDYYLNRSREAAVQSDDTERNEDPPRTDTRIVALRDIKEWAILVIRGAMLLVSGVAVWISIYFSRLWLLSFLSPFRALALAGVMVLYATVAPQIIGVILGHRTIGRWLSIGLIGLTALMVMVFSMTSTVAGQYAGFALTEAEGIQESAAQTVSIARADLITDQITEVRRRIEDKQEEIDAVQVLLKEFDTLEKRTENWTFYLTTMGDLERLGEDMAGLQDELRELRERQAELITEETVGVVESARFETRTFYQWLGGLLSAAPDRVQFWLSMFPAVFVDIIAPLALAIALFLGRNKN